MPFPLWPTAYLLVLAIAFYYFVLAGGKTFEYGEGDELASGAAQFSFVITGTFATMLFGFRAAVPLANAIASGALLLCSIALYEWARRTIRGRRFHIAWSGDVPDALCEDGPFRHLRHPFYLSYVLAFAAMLAALPKLGTLAIFVLNGALFVHAAFRDERDIAASDLSEDYRRYKSRTGMFFPRLFGR